MYGCLDPESEYYCDDCTVDDGSCDCGVEDGEYTYTFSDILNTVRALPIPDQQCTFCHSGASAANNFNMEDYNSVKERVSGCGSVETSILFIEITTGLMQYHANNYTEYNLNLVEMIEIWISEGAPE